MNPDEDFQRFDWGEQFDDLDAEYWDDYLGGPDDDHFEPQFDAAEDQACLEDEPDFSIFDDVDPDEPDVRSRYVDSETVTPAPHHRAIPETGSAEDRKTAIMQWLAESAVSRPLRTGDGFFVPRGMHGRRIDGSVVDILDWLREEGIVAGVAVGGYRVSYTPPGGRYREKLTFFRIVQRIPFALGGHGDGSLDPSAFRRI